MIRILSISVFLVLLFATTSIGQTFNLPELIKLSKMYTDDFDTYVTSKGFAFLEEKNNEHRNGVTYALNINDLDKSKASKFITLYQRYFNKKYSLYYQTLNRKEYLNIKNQIKALGFKLEESNVYTDDEGIASNHFVYKKGKERISIFANFESFEINYQVDF